MFESMGETIFSCSRDLIIAFAASFEAGILIRQTPEPHAILDAVSVTVNPSPAQQTHTLDGLAMIFDMDGVLVDSMPLHVTAWEQYLQGLGVDVHDLERRMHGKRNTELVWDFLGEHVSEKNAIEHGSAKERLFRKLMSAETKETFDVAGVAEFLKRYEHVPKAIGSNAEQENIDFILDLFQMRKYFQFTINGLQVERPKPFPDIYLECARRLGVEPANCIVFEDSPAGAEAGIAASMRVVGVETTPTSFRGIDLQISDFRDPRLEAWLSEQRPV